MIVSYAQNFEDVMLWRALGHVAHGRYLDIGAQDPDVDSVSRLFHENGWHGWHVEPTAYADALKSKRQGDTVLAVALGTKAGLQAFYEIPGTGLSTTRADIAKEHLDRGLGIELAERLVPVVHLSTVLDEIATEGDIHWMKIDVEGAESDVLTSWGDSPVRPWIVVVESTLPLTEIESHLEWEHRVLNRGYAFAYFDGLNRFYVSDSHAHLLDAFSHPPCVFDNFSLSGQASQPFTHLLNGEIRERERLLDQMNECARQERAEKCRIEQDLNAKLTALREHHAQREARLDESARTIQDLNAKLTALQEHHAQREARLDELVRTITESILRIDVELSAGRRALRESNEQRLALQARHDEASSSIEALRSQLESALESNHHSQLRANALQQEITEMLSSRSWRLTAPLRGARRRIFRPFRQAALSTMNFIASKPHLWRSFTIIVDRVPAVSGRLRALAISGGVQKRQDASDVPPFSQVDGIQAGSTAVAGANGAQPLSERGTRIFNALKAQRTEAN